jgi:hypothetical protein
MFDLAYFLLAMGLLGYNPIVSQRASVLHTLWLCALITGNILADGSKSLVLTDMENFPKEGSD